MATGRCPICGRILYGGKTKDEVMHQFIEDQEYGSTICDNCGMEYYQITIDTWE